MGAAENDVLDEGLSRLASTGPEFRGGLSNHGPMAAEALVRLGRAGEVERWLDEYIKRLEEAPSPSRYLELPGSPRTEGRLGLAAAISGLPAAAAEPAPGLITEGLTTGLVDKAGFAAAVGALRAPADVPARLLALAREFTQIFLVYGRRQPIALLHAVTAPVAARSVLPLLPGELARPTYDALWQVCAALYVVYAGGTAPEPLPAGAPPSQDELVDRAVSSGDEHAIKLTEACLRLNAEQPAPVFGHASARAIELLG